MRPKRLDEPVAQPVEREIAVSKLRPLVASGDADFRPDSVEKTLTLPVGERLTGLDVERNRRPGVRGVRVLSARTAGRGESPRKFVRRNREMRVHHEGIVGRRDWWRVVGGHGNSFVGDTIGSLECAASNMVVVAQLVERQVVILDVAGSSPVDHPTLTRAARFGGPFTSATVSSALRL